MLNYRLFLVFRPGKHGRLVTSDLHLGYKSTVTPLEETIVAVDKNAYVGRTDGRVVNREDIVIYTLRSTVRTPRPHSGGRMVRW